jgi:polyhydroxyalkanoate synthase
MFALMDSLRQMHGNVLDLLGRGPTECRYRVVAADTFWRLREYAGAHDGLPLLVVAAPIKRPYIWDLARSASAVRQCLRNGLRVFLLEWKAPADGRTGLADYALQGIGAAVAAISRQAGGAKPFVIGHSLGGTLAAVYAAFDARPIRGLVLLATPLCFAPGSCRFRDALVALAPFSIPATGVIPGSQISWISAMAAPDTFVWSRLRDACLSVGDARAMEVHARVERWALDEFPLPGRLVHEILQWLYVDDRFCRGTLRIGHRTVGPSTLRLPTLAVVNAEDAVAPPAAIRPFVEAMPTGRARLIEHTGETGVGLQHLAVLVGRRAHALVWPEIIAWLHAQARPARVRRRSAARRGAAMRDRH